ncbi:MAG: UvrD-helicase domain-containing protein [Firmicutes bacterium]|nr:UvrD-helicase domain-containing protein [Bacillota bacterium]
MAIEFSDSQRMAINARGHVLVSAAAGSGKTAVLTQRVAECVFDENNPIDIDRMLILTFTEDAAAEMRSRISGKLLDYLAEHPDNARAAKQNLMVDSADISTIDSFCISLIREHFETLGISPDFKIVSGEQEELLKKKAMDEVLDAAYGSNDPDFLSLLELIGDEGEYTVSSYIGKIYSYIRSLPYPEQWMSDVLDMYRPSGTLAGNPWAGRAMNKCKSIIASARRELSRRADCLQYETADNTGDTAFYHEAERMLANLAEQAERSWDDLYFAAVNYAPLPLGRKGKKRNNALLDTVRAAEQTVERIKKLMTGSEDDCLKDIQLVKPNLDRLFHLVDDFSRSYASLKAEQNLLDFSDTEYCVLKLLAVQVDGRTELTEMAQDIIARYDEVMIDEYQDTNDLQDTLVYVLSNKAEHLFLVGDVKQSIYRFRKANPENFLHKKNSFKEYAPGDRCGKVSLGGNYRSRAGVCDFVNGVFSRIMSDDACGMYYRKEDALQPLGTFAPTDSAAVFIDIITDSQLAQEEHIAAEIRRMVSDHYQVSDGKGGLRDIRYSDIAVLMRAPGNKYQLYGAAFRRAGIPFSAARDGGLFDQPEVRLVLSILRAADNPLRDIPLLAAMMSPVFCFTAEEVALIKLNGQKRLYSNLLVSAERDEKSAAFLGCMREMRQACATLSAGEAVRYVIKRLGINTVIAGFGGGEMRRVNLLALIEFAESFDSSQFGGISAFLRYTDSIIEGESDIKRSAPANGDDCVRIMSVHMSKGLQFPVVILAECDGSFNMTDVTSSIVLNAHYGVGLRVFNQAGVKYDTLCRSVISDEEYRETCSEAMRLLYVAMTRAVDRLVIVGSVSNFDNNEKGLMEKIRNIVSCGTDEYGALPADAVLTSPGFLNWILESIVLNAPSVLTGENDGIRLRLIDNCAAEEATADEEPALPPCDIDIAAILGYEYDYEAATAVNTKYSASELNELTRAADNCCNERPAFMSSDRLTPAERGTATHRFMQFADYEAACIDVTAEIGRLVEREYLTAQEGAAIEEAAVRGFFNSELYRQISTADKVMREMKFIYEMPACEVDERFVGVSEPVVVQGVVDCVYIKSGEACIVDFKTDRVRSAEQLLSLYRRQLEVYAAALGSTLGVPIGRCVLYSFSLGGEILVDI